MNKTITGTVNYNDRSGMYFLKTDTGAIEYPHKILEGLLGEKVEVTTRTLEKIEGR